MSDIKIENVDGSLYVNGVYFYVEHYVFSRLVFAKRRNSDLENFGVFSEFMGYRHFYRDLKGSFPNMKYQDLVKELIVFLEIDKYIECEIDKRWEMYYVDNDIKNSLMRMFVQECEGYYEEFQQRDFNTNKQRIMHCFGEVEDINKRIVEFKEYLDRL